MLKNTKYKVNLYVFVGYVDKRGQKSYFKLIFEKFFRGVSFAPHGSHVFLLTHASSKALK